MYSVAISQVPGLGEDGIDVATRGMVLFGVLAPSLWIGALKLSWVSCSWQAEICGARALNLPVLRPQEFGGGRGIEIRSVKVCFTDPRLGWGATIACFNELAELLLELLDPFGKLLWRAVRRGGCGGEERNARHSVTLRVSAIDAVFKTFGALSRLDTLIRDVQTRGGPARADTDLTWQFAIAPDFSASASNAGQGRPSSTLLRRCILHVWWS